MVTIKISKYQNTFAKSYVSNRSEEVFMIKKKGKNTVPWTYGISYCNDEKNYWNVELDLFNYETKSDLKKATVSIDYNFLKNII